MLAPPKPRGRNGDLVYSGIIDTYAFGIDSHIFQTPCEAVGYSLCVSKDSVKEKYKLHILIMPLSTYSSLSYR